MTWLSVVGYVLLSLWSPPNDLPSPEKPETLSASSVTDKDTASLSLFFYEDEAVFPSGGTIDVTARNLGDSLSFYWEPLEYQTSEGTSDSVAPCNLRDQITTLLFPFHTFW